MNLTEHLKSIDCGAEHLDCFLPKNLDVLDRGVSVYRRQESKNEAENYPEPISLDIESLIPMPKEIFTGWFGDMVSACSRATETPIELPALLGLSVLAAACQRKFIVSIEPGYREPLNIWAVVALEPGNRKTAVLQAMTKPLMEWEKETAETVSGEIKETEARRKNQEAQINSLRSQYAKANSEDAGELGKEIIHLEIMLPEVPPIPRLWAQDITPEKLGQLMADHGEKIAVMSDEGGIFDILAGRYSGGIPNLDVFLQSHAGSPVRVDRGSRKSVHMNSPALTMGLSPQPEVLRSLTGKPGFRGRGLLARFLYALPESRLGFRLLNCDPISEGIFSAYNKGIRSLLDIKPPVNAHGDIEPYTLRLSHSAHEAWKDFQREIEKGMREGETFEHIQDWAGKLPGAVGRLAGLFHCAEYHAQQPWTIEIGDETLDRALNLAAFLSRHALAAFDLMGADCDLEAARKVWRWIERHHMTTFSARDCFEALKGTFKRMSEINPAFDVLMERNHIFELQEPKDVGRPSRRFIVNPAITETWK